MSLGLLEKVFLVLLGVVGGFLLLTACTAHTRYYSTDGTRTTEIERTTQFGAPEQRFDGATNATDIP